jgi:deoxyadenosine/deoxycytidine kinase
LNQESVFHDLPEVNFHVTTLIMTPGYYISVMGTMGSGKSTAAKLIAQNLKFTLLAENFGENAFLPRFYQDMKRWAFHSQTFFLMEKVNQMLNTCNLLKHSSIVQDTPIEQDVFSYAQAQHEMGNIDNAEWQLYQNIYKSFVPYFPKPDLLIFLSTSVRVLADRIKTRGRGYESSIPEKYLLHLDKLNRKWLATYQASPVLTIETDNLDIVRDNSAQKSFMMQIENKLTKKH